MCFEYNRLVRLVLADEQRIRNPDWTEAQVQQGVARIMLGVALCNEG